MNDDLRMDLADQGAPDKLVEVILRHHPQWTSRVPIEQLAVDVGIEEIKDLGADGFEGALLTDPAKNRGVILTKAGANEGRRRFTIGHELGHFLIPSHKGNQQCTAADLRQNRLGNAREKQEVEANRFSASLLMPRAWFLRQMGELGRVELQHVQDMAADFGTSFQATAHRYIELTSDNCAIVFSKDGVVRYPRWTPKFPRLAVRKGDPLPAHCRSRRAPPAPLQVVTDWDEVDGAVWLEASYGDRLPTLLEQSFRQEGGYQVTLLFVDQPAEADEEGEEGELEEKWTPRFSR